MNISSEHTCAVILCPDCVEWGESADCTSCGGAGTQCIPNAEVKPNDTIVGHANPPLQINQGGRT